MYVLYLPQHSTTQNINGAIDEDSNFSSTLLGDDIDGNNLLYIIVSNPSNGTVTLTSSSQGTFIYTPTANYNGNDALEIYVSDGTNTSR